MANDTQKTLGAPGMAENGQNGDFYIVLPLPPPDNQCHRTGGFIRYATKAYKDFLELSAPLIRAKLGNTPPDTSAWWEVNIAVWNKPRGGDVQNYVKPVLDSLMGAQVDDRGKIVKPGGLYDDDKRVKRVQVELLGTHDEDPRVCVSASTTEPPQRWKKRR